MIYQNAPSSQSDIDFEAGDLAHLVAGNHARLLDPRRTPVRIVALYTDIAAFSVEITAFEDKGAVWQLPLWHVEKFQFQKSAKRLPAKEVANLERLVDRYGRKIFIEIDLAKVAETQNKLKGFRRQADDWLSRNSVFFEQNYKTDLATQDGLPSLQSDLVAWMQQFKLENLDAQFAENFATNPASSELVKGHRMVLAEIGLCPYKGSIQRDPELFSGLWGREQRALHVLVRMAFVQSVFLRLGYEKLPLFRTVYSNSAIDPPRNKGFVSTTFSPAVASSLFESGQACEKAVMGWQNVPVDRLFMTHFETARLNQPYREAEAILLYDTDNPLF